MRRILVPSAGDLALRVPILLGCLCCMTAGFAGCRRQPAAVNEPDKVARPEAAAAEQRVEIRFADVTSDTGIVAEYQNGQEAGHTAILESLGGGAAIFDMDEDGYQDVLVTGGGGFEGKRILGLPSKLFRNLGNWKFEDVSQEAGGFGSSYYTHGCFVGDYDNDGFDDVLITGYGGLELWKNQGDGTFLPVARSADLNDHLWSSAAAWGDVDGDGYLDLYVAHYVNWSFSNHPVCMGPTTAIRDVCPPKVFSPLPDTLFRNQGDGTFRDVSESSGLRKDGKGLGVIMGDIDLDGDVDIYVANDTTDNFMYFNDGNGVFRETAVVSGVAVDDRGTPNGSMGLDLGDYNLDGRPDIWVANFEVESFALYRNDGGEQFLHVSRATGVTALSGLFVGFGTAFLDVDHDGDEDIVVSNGHVIHYPRNAPVLQQALLLINENGQRFRRYEFPPDSYFSKTHIGRGLALGDLDNDGDMDLVFANDHEPLAVLRNDTSTPNGTLQVELIGTTSNRNAVGAHVFLRSARGKQLRLVKSGVSYLSHGDWRLEWGVPAGDAIEALEVYWPGGAYVELPLDPASNSVRVWQPGVLRSEPPLRRERSASTHPQKVGAKVN